MATLFFCVFDSASATGEGDPIQEGTITITGTSAQSAAISAGDGPSNVRKRVRLFTDTNCFVTWGADPTAADDGSEGRPMTAEGVEYFDIQAGHKLATITR